MEPLAFVLQKTEGGTPPEQANVLSHCLRHRKPYGFVGSFRQNDVPQNVSTVPVGSVEFCQTYMDVLNIARPAPIGLPESLKKFLGRDVRALSLDEVLFELEKKPAFVKPADTVKTFTGRVFTSKQDFLETLAGLPASWRKDSLFPTKFYVADPVVFEQEWRIYIIQGKTVGTGRYDPNETPDSFLPTRLIGKILDSYGRKAPSDYSIELGLTKNGWALVELNDAWALSAYHGISSDNYAKILETRWKELVQERIWDER